MTAASADLALTQAVQYFLARGFVPKAARFASCWGEHSLGWLAVAALGAGLSSDRQDLWVRAGTAALGAHAASVVVKRLVRRQRPQEASVRVLVGTPSRLSFPSAHASSTTAFAVTVAPVIGRACAATLVVAMGISRVVLGVHYPSDVLAGAGVGALTALSVARLGRRRSP